MTTHSRDDAISILRQFVHGEISTRELLQFVRRRQLFGLEDLLDSIQLRTDDFAAIALGAPGLSRRIEQFLGREIHLGEFAEWVYQLHQIYSASEYQVSEFYSREIEISLMLLALVVDLDVTEGPRLTKRLVGILHNALQRHHAIPSALMLRKLFAGKRCLHLATRHSGAAPDRPWRENQWADARQAA